MHVVGNGHAEHYRHQQQRESNRRRAFHRPSIRAKCQQLLSIGV